MEMILTHLRSHLKVEINQTNVDKLQHARDEDDINEDDYDW